MVMIISYVRHFHYLPLVDFLIALNIVLVLKTFIRNSFYIDRILSFQHVSCGTVNYRALFVWHYRSVPAVLS